MRFIKYGFAVIPIIAGAVWLTSIKNSKVETTNPQTTQKATPRPYPAMYWEKLEGDIVQCHLCPRNCVLKPGQRGWCRVRENVGGELKTMVYGLPAAVHTDPIEKKPLFHFLPSTEVFSIATAGCNLRCKFCQNWQISQRTPEETQNIRLPPEEIVRIAKERKCPSIAFTYTEPVVFYEYMLATAKLARTAGIRNTMHSAGYINPEPLRELLKYMDAVNIDLKGFTDEYYQEMAQAHLAPVIRTLKVIKEEGVWLEITNLIVPTKNDDPETIRKMCVWIRDSLGADIPLHFSRFWPMYKLKNLPPTPIATLEKARKIAIDVGLHYVYIGNVPGHPSENTYCPSCRKILIQRSGYMVVENNIVDGKCKFCGQRILGIWR